MTPVELLANVKKFAPYALVALLLGLGYLYFDLSNDTQHIDDHRTIVTNHWTGEVQRCVVMPTQKRACKPAKPIAVPWYMEIVQHTVESFK